MCVYILHAFIHIYIYVYRTCMYTYRKKLPCSGLRGHAQGGLPQRLRLLLLSPEAPGFRWSGRDSRVPLRPKGHITIRILIWHIVCGIYCVEHMVYGVWYMVYKHTG